MTKAGRRIGSSVGITSLVIACSLVTIQPSMQRGRAAITFANPARAGTAAVTCTSVAESAIETKVRGALSSAGMEASTIALTWPPISSASGAAAYCPGAYLLVTYAQGTEGGGTVIVHLTMARTVAVTAYTGGDASTAAGLEAQGVPTPAARALAAKACPTSTSC